VLAGGGRPGDSTPTGGRGKKKKLDHSAQIALQGFLLNNNCHFTELIHSLDLPLLLFIEESELVLDAPEARVERFHLLVQFLELVVMKSSLLEHERANDDEHGPHRCVEDMIGVVVGDADPKEPQKCSRRRMTDGGSLYNDPMLPPVAVATRDKCGADFRNRRVRIFLAAMAAVLAALAVGLGKAMMTL